MDLVNPVSCAEIFDWRDGLARGRFPPVVPQAANDDRLGPPPTLPVAIARQWTSVRPFWAVG